MAKFTVNVVDGQVQLDERELATLGVDLPVPVAGPVLRRVPLVPVG